MAYIHTHTYIYIYLELFWGDFPGGSAVENLLVNAGDMGLIPGSRSSLREGMETHSSIFAWEIPWTEEPGGLQSTDLQQTQA